MNAGSPYKKDFSRIESSLFILKTAAGEVRRWGKKEGSVVISQLCNENCIF
jgi:hypothetical protein